MRERFDPQLKARLTLDDADRVRGINHVDEYWPSDEKNARSAAIGYVKQVASTLNLPPDQLDHLHQAVSYADPSERGTEYRISEEKQLFDSTTAGFYQTHLNVPVWGAGLTVTIKHSPLRVVSAVNTSLDAVRARLPSNEVIERYRRLFRAADQDRQAAGLARAPEGPGETTPAVRDLLAGRLFKAARRRATTADRAAPRNAQLIRGRFFVYRYDPAARLPRPPTPSQPTPGEPTAGAPLQEREPTLPLPAVDRRIRAGRDYLVAEITFFYPTPEWGDINWLALVELETGSILYLRALAANVNGLVYTYDPITETGDNANGPDKSNVVLNPFRDDVPLANLNAPIAGTQSLQGARATLTDIEILTLQPPTKPAGSDFDYQVRTNEFAAVNAYYHVDRFFALVEDLGFPLASYFNATTFPVPVDHRGKGTPANQGNTVNAHCVGNGMGGIGHLCYALAHLGDTVNPVGIAADWRVHLHELGGHGILYEHVNSANFGFSHSAGDSMAVILNDPDSKAPDRFLLVPWVPAIVRRHDRDVAAGWAWGGSQDGGSYDSEQILSTTLFRVYRSIGGDSSNVNRRWFAARMMAYLILRAVSTLTPATNPSNAKGFADALQVVDVLNWTSEGLYGGAYNKVIRWSFEKQGLYQAPGAPTPVTSPGQPPEVDVYIDDGRGGEYQYQAVHWNTTTIWNRRKPDDKPNHQHPKIGQPNYAYVKIKNRGTQTANNVVVRGYHCKPSAGVLWPNDFQSFTTPQLAAGSLLGNNAQEKVVGPFEWQPVVNAWGHDCMLMIVSATNDPSNVDNFTLGEVIQDWRLVPNDNNVGQRNVHLVPGGGGGGGLMEGLDGFSVWVGNPNPGRAVIEVGVTLPPLLAERGWRLSFRGLRSNRFTLPYGKQRELIIELQPGGTFEPDDVEAAADRDIVLEVSADGGLIGGMTYRLDPTMERPLDRPGGRKAKPCHEQARELLECLDVHDQAVVNARVKKITVDIDVDGKCH